MGITESVVWQGETDTKHAVQQAFHELIAIVINSMKEMLRMEAEGGGKSVTGWTPLLKMLYLLQGNLHAREGQAAFLCGTYHMITLKRGISLRLGSDLLTFD